MSFDPGELKQRAIARTGLRDFGSAPLDDGLEAFCQSLCEEAGLNEAGRAATEESIVATLSERLRVEQCFSSYPEILEQRLLQQIFVVGLPRTGSTALSQFLSEDPSARTIRRWEVNSLTPPPDASVEDDPRLVATREAFRARDKAMPAFRSMLPIEAQDASEHGPLLGLTFRNLQLPVLYHLPSYTRWLLAADMTPAYAYLADVLKLLQWKVPSRHWNLKNPTDLFGLDALHAVFPDATLIWTHRDPSKVIASVASLASMQRAPIVEHLEKPRLIKDLLSFHTEAVRRGLSARSRIGEARFVDTTQAELARAPVGLLQAIYAKVGLPFDPAFERHLRARIEARPRGQHGDHKYDPTAFGVTADELRRPFENYLEQFEALAL